MKNILRNACFSVALLPLAACGFFEQDTKATKVTFYEAESRATQVSSESLLKADGFMSFAGLNTAKVNPMDRHAYAKDRVDPSKVSGHFPYTDYLKRADMLAHSQHREITMEEDSGTFTVASLAKKAGAGFVPAPAARPMEFAALADQMAAIKVARADVASKAADKASAKPAAVQVAAVKSSKIEGKALKVASVATSDDVVVDAVDTVVKGNVADSTKAFAPKRSIVAAVEESIRRSVFGMMSRENAGRSGEVSSVFTASSKLNDPELNVVNMRMGDYEDKTRLVLDLSAAAKFDYALDNSARNVLTVHINDANWDLQSKRYFDGHPLIESYEVSESRDHDLTLTVSLKQPSKMLMSGFVRPDAKRGYRIFFDMAAL